ncbi:MGMT family protein [Candidatus Bipolaricaulota bacterium]|nr:MGMT family protein [Candidatus Bipolaricaulota bacterium]
MSTVYERIYRVVRQIPLGKVATYGQVARLVGPPCNARIVGWALAALEVHPVDPAVPWQRVINAKGKVSIGNEQRELLEQEGVAFDIHGRIDLTRFGWDGPEGPTPPRPMG